MIIVSLWDQHVFTDLSIHEIHFIKFGYHIGQRQPDHFICRCSDCCYSTCHCLARCYSLSQSICLWLRTVLYFSSAKHFALSLSVFFVCYSHRLFVYLLLVWSLCVFPVYSTHIRWLFLSSCRKKIILVSSHVACCTIRYSYRIFVYSRTCIVSFIQ